MENYYDLLEINMNFTTEELKKKYREFVKRYHPDKYMNESSDIQNKMKNKFLKISKAYEILSDEKLKKEYDLSLNKDNKERNKKMDMKNNNFNKEAFFNKKDIFSDFFNQTKNKEDSNGDLKKNINKQFTNFFGFKGMKK